MGPSYFKTQRRTSKTNMLRHIMTPQKKDYNLMYNSPDAVSIRERDALWLGKLSYTDVLYGRQTPCGKYYETLHPILHQNEKVASSKIMQKFEQCVAEHQDFYVRRNSMLHTIKDETESSNYKAFFALAS